MAGRVGGGQSGIQQAGQEGAGIMNRHGSDSF
jgi:hypothetical protein